MRADRNLFKNAAEEEEEEEGKIDRRCRTVGSTSKKQNPGTGASYRLGAGIHAMDGWVDGMG